MKRTDDRKYRRGRDYRLTALGRSLAQALVPLCTWGTEHMGVCRKRDLDAAGA